MKLFNDSVSFEIESFIFINCSFDLAKSLRYPVFKKKEAGITMNICEPGEPIGLPVSTGLPDSFWLPVHTGKNTDSRGCPFLLCC